MPALALNSPRPAAAQQRQAQRPLLVTSADDIPQARRTVAVLRRRGWRGRLGAGALIGFAVALAAAIVVPGLLPRSSIAPGLNALGVKPDRDGRLLGHFPYQEVESQQLVAIAPGVELQRDAARSFVLMQEAARADGVDLVVLSAFRSKALQEKLFFEVKSDRNQTARERAQVSAPPGYSEHSTGYAIDLGDGAAPQANLSPSFDQTAAYDWLRRNAARYHFELSFPQGNAQGVSYEPWHWRFEGTAQALRVFEPAQRMVR